jgi:hypothetical protein
MRGTIAPLPIFSEVYRLLLLPMNWVRLYFVLKKTTEGGIPHLTFIQKNSAQMSGLYWLNM